MKSLYFPLDAKVSLFRLKIKIKQIIPQRVVEYSFNFQTNPIQEKKKFENRTQESRPENSLINHHENCDRTISMPSRFPFPRSHTAPSKEEQSNDFRNRDCFLPFPSPSILPRLKEVPVEEEKTGRKKFRLETIE